jgi:hypothetical protein
MYFGYQNIVAGRNLKNTVKERAYLMPTEFNGVIDRLCVPAGWHPGGEQGLHFRCEVNCFVMESVEQRLDAESVAGGEHGAIDLIPEHKSKLTAQAMQALGAEVFVEMQRDLAVGASAQAMAGLFELPQDGLVTVELAVDDNAGTFVLAGDGLVPCGQVYDAETRVAERDALVRRNPVALAIGPAMIQTLGGPLHVRRRDRITAREGGNYSAHFDVLRAICVMKGFERA